MSTTFLPAEIENVVTRIHEHGFDEAAQRLAPCIQVRYAQLERGSVCFRGVVARRDRVVVGRYGGNCNKVEWLDVPSGRTFVIMPMHGRGRFGTASLVPGRALFAVGPTQIVTFSDPEYRACFASLPTVGRQGHRTVGAPELSGAARIRLINVGDSRLRTFQRCVQRLVTAANAERALLQIPAGFYSPETALVHLCDAWLREDDSQDCVADASTARCYAAVRARQYIDDHLDQPLLLASVCKASFSSPRALEYGFREIFGVSPIAYIRCARLSRVRRELHFAPQASGRITQLAMKWGFWHLSQFSKDYYELFGELPSTTLGRAGCSSRPLARLDCDRSHASVDEPTVDLAEPREFAQIR